MECRLKEWPETWVVADRSIRLLKAFIRGSCNIIRVLNGRAAACVHLWRCLDPVQVNSHLCRCRDAPRRWRSGGAAWTGSHSGHPAPSEDKAEAVGHKYNHKQNIVSTKRCWIISRELHMVCKIAQPKNKNKALVLYIFRPDSRYECFIFSFTNNAIILLIWNSNSENKNTFSVRGI